VKEREYATMAATERDHWWYRSLRARVLAALHGRIVERATLLDAGCGTGGTYQAVTEEYPQATYIGLEPRMAGLNSSRSCGLRRLVRGRIPDLPFLPKTFDAIVCLDVLYYEDISREDALRRFAELLRPGGMLVMNLPAFSCLRGRHDLAVGIHGRFRKRSVDAMLAEAGFDEASSSYWNTSLFMPILIWRWLSRLWPGEVESDVGLSPGWVNRVLAALLGAEQRVGKWVPMPLGTSVLTTAIRRAECRSR
jgi:SAM-dependent methyltransferase